MLILFYRPGQAAAQVPPSEPDKTQVAQRVDMLVSQGLTATPAMLAKTPTPYPTYTPYPTPTNVIIEMARFSFYDPAIGADKPDIALINCADWDTVNKVCNSKLRDGSDYKDMYLKAAACRFDLYNARAEFKVLSPEWLKNLFPDGFTCRDTGDAVNGLFIDFLIPWRSMPMKYDQTPWGYPVALLRVK